MRLWRNFGSILRGPLMQTLHAQIVKDVVIFIDYSLRLPAPSRKLRF